MSLTSPKIDYQDLNIVAYDVADLATKLADTIYQRSQYEDTAEELWNLAYVLDNNTFLAKQTIRDTITRTLHTATKVRFADVFTDYIVSGLSDIFIENIVPNLSSFSINMMRMVNRRFHTNN